MCSNFYFKSLYLFCVTIIFYKLVLVQRKNCNKTIFVFNMLYVRWCSACVEGAFKYLIIACAGSTKLITTQTCRVYKSNFTSVQSVTSALQTKRIVIELLAVSLYCSGTGRPSRANGF